MIGSLLPWITMSSQSLIFEGALHLCFAVSERASEIPSCYISYYDCFEKVLSSEIYYYCSLVDYAIDMSKLETYALSWYKEINNNFIIASRAYFLQLVHNLCWKLECWLHIFAPTRANRVWKGFSLSLSVCQLNCLRTSKGLSLGKLICLRRIYFSKHFCPCFGL